MSTADNSPTFAVEDDRRSEVATDFSDGLTKSRVHEHNINQNNSPHSSANGDDGTGRLPDRRIKKKKSSATTSSMSATAINYHGLSIFQAANQGNLPLCVLLWGIASAKRVNLITQDAFGNNPMHFAALADTPEVIGFLIQQTRGYYNENTRLVDTRNNAGETPLLRAMNTGVNAVAKALVEEGSDLFAVDNTGNTIFSTLAKAGKLWCMNFMYLTVCNFHGPEAAIALLMQLDNECHSALDWAADAGDVNMLEFLIRMGLHPRRVDKLNRGPLYWAVKSCRIEAARFLVMCGCDPHSVDGNGKSIMALAVKSGNRDLLKALTCFRPSTKLIPHAGPYDASFTSNNANAASAAANAGTVLHTTSTCSNCWGTKVKNSYAIYHHNPSRASHVLLYASIVFVMWMSSLVIPFYGWIPMVAVLLYGFRYYEHVIADALVEQHGNDRSKLSKLQELIHCPEKGLGVWLGGFSVFAVYLVISIVWPFETEPHFLPIAGTNSEHKDLVLFWTVFWLFVLCGLMWLKIAWWDTDPGRIDTRDRDFEEVMEQSLLASGSPPAHSYCRTTLVKKPLRSKFCTKMGFVVSRMDHYCIWLNISIGQKNHRSFMVFLLLHTITTALIVCLLIRALHDEISSFYSCNVLSSILSRKSFYTTTLCAFMSIIFVGLAFLTADQLSNIANNITTNEKINSSRYSYLQDEEGNFLNRFDRGVLSNFLEFLQVPGFSVDYSAMFTSPDALPPTGNKKEEKKVSRSWWSCSNGSGKDQHDTVPSNDVEEGMGGLSDFYSHSNSNSPTNFQSGDGLIAGTLEMRRRKDTKETANNNNGGSNNYGSSPAANEVVLNN